MVAWDATAASAPALVEPPPQDCDDVCPSPSRDQNPAKLFMPGRHPNGNKQEDEFIDSDRVTTTSSGVPLSPCLEGHLSREDDEKDLSSQDASPHSVDRNKRGTSALWQRRVASRCPILAVTPATPQQAVMADRQNCLERLYELCETIGHGSTSTVSRAVRWSDGVTVALKTFKSSDPEMLRFARDEFDLLRKLQHPHIVRAYDFHSFGSHDVMSLEYFRGGSLDGIIAKKGFTSGIPEGTVCLLTKQLFQAVFYLHGLGILHRDVGPTNVMASDLLDDLRLIDFNAAVSTDERCGFVRVDGNSETSPPLTPTGTRLFAAPEVLGGTPSSECSDVWMAGLCTHFLLAGQLPQGRGNGRSAVSHRLLQIVAAKPVDLRAPSFSSCSTDCLEFLGAVLALTPEARPRSEEVLQMPWLLNDARLPPGGKNDAASPSTRDDEIKCSEDRRRSSGSEVSGRKSDSSDGVTPWPLI